MPRRGQTLHYPKFYKLRKPNTLFGTFFLSLQAIILYIFFPSLNDIEFGQIS